MFFILSKTLFYALMPIIWIITTFAIGLFMKNKLKAKKILFLSFGLLLFFTNPYFQNKALLKWEVPACKIDTLSKYDYAIVLTGITNTRKKPNDRIYFDKGADRITEALHLYRIGKISKIIITGGGADIIGPNIVESESLKNFLLLANVPEKDIIIENKARNTRENALFTAELIDSLRLNDSRFLLITSSFHMRRSLACFNKVKIKTTPFPVDFHTTDKYTTPNFLFIPSEKSLYEWGILIHEITGFIVYNVIGYA